MRKILGLIITISLLISNDAFAQFESVRLGGKAGLNLSDMTDGHHSRLKYQLGVTIDYEFTPNFFIMSGLSYKTKGAKRKVKDSFLYGPHNITTDPAYIETPVHLACKLTLGGNTRLVFSSGTYMALGVSGTSKRIYRAGDEKIIRETPYFGSGRASRFDMGLGVTLGIELDNICFGLGYDYGLLDNKQVDGLNTKNRNVAFTIGYKL